MGVGFVVGIEPVVVAVIVVGIGFVVIVGVVVVIGVVCVGFESWICFMGFL